jgi:tripartite ATP-independent transporter DctM subunit
MKEMPKAGYSRADAAATVIAASTLGPIIPPSIMFVIYAITANVSIARLFVAGIVPGLLIVVILMITIDILTRTGRMACPPPSRFSWARLWKTGREAFLALLAPVVILRSMSTGIVTPTEAGILAVVYALAVGAIQRRFPVRQVIAVLRETVEGTALIMYIIAVSSALSWVFVAEGTGKLLTEKLLGLTSDPLVFLLLVNVLLLVIGCLIETLPAMLITVPILLPTAKALGIDLVHFGLIVVFNLIIGIMTPPMGIGLYILMAISNVRFGELVRASLPFVCALLVALTLLTIFPQITLFLPDLLVPEPGARR